MPDPLERLTNLLALLLETRVPLSQQQIIDQLADYYPTGAAARHTMFERDKRELRAIGVPIEQEVLGGDQAGQTAYRVDRARYELGDLGLTEDERHALQLAVATVRLDTGSADEALWKLGGAAGEAPPPPVAAHLPSGGEALARLAGAAGRRAPVRFRYRGVARELDPYGVLARDGAWYVVGHDHRRDALRTFRVDRIEGSIDVGDPGGFERPSGLDVRAAVGADPKAFGEPGDAADREADVLIDGPPAAGVVAELGEAAVIERHPDGVVVRVPCVNREAFRWWVLGFGEHAEVLGPPSVREEVVAWLRAAAG